MYRSKHWNRLLVGALCVLALPAMALAGSKVAVFHLDGPLIEKPQGEMGFAFGAMPETLKSLLERFRQADKDDEIKAMLITVGAPQMGPAQLEELSDAISSASKPVYAHVDSLGTGLYAMLSSVRHLSVTPTGDVWLLGLYSETPYLRGLLDHLNIAPDFVHIGDYKSAGETLMRKGPSEEAAANMNWLYDGIYSQIVKHIAENRFNDDEGKVKDIIDNGPYTAEQAKEIGLIDSVKHRQDIVAELKKRFGDDLKFVHNYGGDTAPELDFENPFALFQVISELMAGKPKSTKTGIAIVYVEGPIMTGSEQASLFGGSSGAFSTTIRKGLDEAAADDAIKAVVLRVDSPGGSALASEIIYDATQRIREKGKPVVVSMGNVAASGGYYVSCGSNHIFADPMTITASIGVVGGKLVTTGMWDMIGVSWHSYQRGDSAAIMSNARPWNDTERKKILDWMTDVYGIFKGHIVEHRGKKLAKDIEEMAGGRVFTGAQAAKLGLVDELGTFDDAVKKAADLAMISDYELRVLPRPQGLFDFLREGMGGNETDRVQASASANLWGSGAPGSRSFTTGSPLFDAALPIIQSLDPQRAKVLMQALTRLQLIHEEQVIIMTPEDWLIRFE